MTLLAVLTSGCAAPRDSTILEAQSAIRKFDEDGDPIHLRGVRGSGGLICEKRGSFVQIRFRNRDREPHTDLISIDHQGTFLHLEYVDKGQKSGEDEEFIVEKGVSEAIKDYEDGNAIVKVIWHSPGEYVFALTEPLNRWIDIDLPEGKYDPDLIRLLGFCKINL
jgi:hypothetical protein